MKSVGLGTEVKTFCATLSGCSQKPKNQSKTAYRGQIRPPSFISPFILDSPYRPVWETRSLVNRRIFSFFHGAPEIYPHILYIHSKFKHHGICQINAGSLVCRTLIKFLDINLLFRLKLYIITTLL